MEHKKLSRRNFTGGISATSIIPGSDKLLVVWNHSEYDMSFGSHYGRRKPLMALSPDGGVSFTDFRDIESDRQTVYANPAIAWTRDDVCLPTYWTGHVYDEKGDRHGNIDLKLARFRIKTCM